MSKKIKLKGKVIPPVKKKAKNKSVKTLQAEEVSPPGLIVTDYKSVKKLRTVEFPECFHDFHINKEGQTFVEIRLK